MLQGSISILYILILFLIIQFKTFELLKQDKKNHFKNTNEMPCEEKSLDEIQDFHYNSNNFINFGIVKRIKYLPCSFYTNACSVNVNLNSACLRCEVCLSIVDKINQTLIFVHERILQIHYLNETQIESLFKTICEYSFTNYGLRNINGNRVISDRISKANLISTSADDQWTKYLQTRCYDLTEQMGSIKLYKYWKFWWDKRNYNEEYLDLETVLCRDDNVYFRDCKNIAHTKREVLNNIENMRLKEKINDIFGCI